MASNNSIFVGANTKPLVSGGDNKIIIGSNTVGAGSNSIVLRNAAITTNLFRRKVGIGTTTPQNALAVNGTVTARQIKINRSDWPDYVFSSTYHLPKLSKTESFIKKEHHLPGIPTQEEIISSWTGFGGNADKRNAKNRRVNSAIDPATI